MASPLIVTCALTGGMTVPSQSSAIPVTPEQIVDSGVEACEAGASVLHVHVREPLTGRPVSDIGLFREVLTGLAERCDAILQPTTGGGVGMTIEERLEVVDVLGPDMASLNVGSFNFGLFPLAERTPGLVDWERDYLESTRDFVFRNTFAYSERAAALFAERGTKPEIEIYDVSHLYTVVHLVRRGLLAPPVQLQFVLGVFGAMSAEVDHLLYLVRSAERTFDFPYTWAAAGVGYPHEFELATVAMLLGGHVRVGLEDNLRIAPGQKAVSNRQLVEKVVRLAEEFDRVPASPGQARTLLGMPPEPWRAPVAADA